MPNTYTPGPVTFVAGEALEKYRRVKLYGNTVGSREVVYADAGEDYVGITQEKAAINESVCVLIPGSGTFLCESAGAITAEATVYGANDGKIDDTVSGDPIGTALEAASGAAVMIEVVPVKTSTVAELNGVTAGTIAASKAVVVDANKDASEFRNVGIGGTLTIGDAGIVAFGDGSDVTLVHDGTDGLKIGNTALQKLGFFGATPAAQPAHNADPAATASDPNALTAAALTVADGAGSNDGTIAAITTGGTAADQAPVIAAIQELADQINKIVADITSIRTQLVAAIDDIQANNAAIDALNADAATLGFTAAS